MQTSPDQTFVSDLLSYSYSLGSTILIHKIANDFTKKSNLFFFRTDIACLNAPTLYGYSSSTDDKYARNISLAEAVERLAFQSVFFREKLEENQNQDRCSITGTRLLTGVNYSVDSRRALGIDPKYPSTSSGNAIHYDQREAALNATIELHERNVLMYNFYVNRNSPCKIDNEEIIQTYEKTFESLDFFGYTVGLYFYHFKDLPLTCICSIRAKKPTLYPYVLIGTGSSFMPINAMLRAFEEALRMWIFNYFQSDLKLEMAKQSVDQARHYFNYELGKHLVYFLESGAQTSSKSFVKEPISNEKSLFEHYDPICISLLEYKSLKVVRAFSDFCCPLFFGQNLPMFPWQNDRPSHPLLAHPY
jgi:hypothetical protein